MATIAVPQKKNGAISNRFVTIGDCENGDRKIDSLDTLEAIGGIDGFKGGVSIADVRRSVG